MDMNSSILVFMNSSILVGVILLLLKELFNLVKNKNNKNPHNPTHTHEMKEYLNIHEEKAQIRHEELKRLLYEIRNLVERLIYNQD